MSDPLVLRPRRLRLVAALASAGVLLTFTLIAVLLGRTDGEASFRLPDQIAMIGLGALLASGPLILGRSRVVADEATIRVRNAIGETVLPWAVVRAVRMDDGASWASLDLHDDDTVALLAVQSNDGEAAVDAVLALRRLLAASRSAPPS